MVAKSDKIWFMIAIGTVWGLMETLLGMALRQTSIYFLTGSIMTGLVGFLLIFGQTVSRRLPYLAIPLTIVIIFKALDAWMLHLPAMHGSIGNPVFAMFLEVGALAGVVAVSKPYEKQRYVYQIGAGALYAILAVIFFPMVKYFTGVPACVVSGTSIPLCLYYAPLAILIAGGAFPLGIALGLRTSLKLENSFRPAIKYALQGLSLTAILIAVLVRL